MFPTAYAGLFPQIRGSVTIVNAIDMTDFIKTDLSSVPSVSDVEVRRRGNDFEVNVFLANFERTLRRRIYAKEKALHREFPDYSFDFNLVDVSEQNDVLDSAVSS
jgi:hypothetical protein